MIENLWVLLFLLLIPLYFIWRNDGYIRHPATGVFPTKKLSISWRVLCLVGFVFLVLAASNIVLSFKEIVRVNMAHKYVLVNDASGSMIDQRQENGIGSDMKAVLAGNRKLLSMLGDRIDGSRDLVSLIIFSDDAFVVSYFVEDGNFIYKKLERIDYRQYPLNRGTNLQAALLSGINLILSYGKITDDVIDRLAMRFYGHGFDLKQDGFIDTIIAKKKDYEGASIIVFTDGYFMTPGGSTNMMSAYKLINFCKLAGIRVYFISVAIMSPELTQLCLESGGDVLIIRNINESKLEKIYQSIVESQANEYTSIELDKDYSLSVILGCLALAFLSLGLALHNSSQLNYTEV